MRIKEKGFSLVQVMMGAGLMGGLALVFVQLGKNMNQIQGLAQAKAEEIDLKSSISMLLSDPKHCRLSLAGEGPAGAPTTPVKFEKSEIDEEGEGLEVELFYANQAGDARSQKRFSGIDSAFSKFGKIEIKSISLRMNNGNGFDYSPSAKHSDIGQLIVALKKQIAPKKYREMAFQVDTLVSMSTAADGATTILGCSASAGGGGGVPSGAVMSFALTSCPFGWSNYAAANGRFIRGIDVGAKGIDPEGERAPGHIQEDAVKEHTHTVDTYYNSCTANDYGGSGSPTHCRQTTSTKEYETTFPLSGASVESRPKNVALLYCVKD